jgi:hypothetical protein
MGTRPLVQGLLLACALAGCTREDADDAPRNTVDVDAIEGARLIVAARDRSDEDLVAGLVAVAEDPELAADTDDDASIAAAEARLALDLPAELEKILRMQAASGALGWYGAAGFERADSMGDELGAALHLDRAGWRDRSVRVENLDGVGDDIRASVLASYLVLGRSVLGELILYDASPEPRHACCRLVEVPLEAGDTATGYASVHDWLATMYGLHQAVLE